MEASELARGVLDASPGSKQFLACSRSLAELAFSRNRKVAAEATRIIFDDIVQRWADRFEPDLCDVHASFMAEVVYAQGSPVATRLADLGYARPENLLERYGKVQSGELEEAVDGDEVSKVVVLSRVSLGEDIAVTSPIIHGSYCAFRSALVQFIGPKKNIYLIANGHSIGRCEISYSRDSLLANRLMAWTRVRARVRACTEGLGPGEWLVVDPGSCLTQMGLLPIADDRYYRLFESRSWDVDDPSPIGELAGEWCGGQWFLEKYETNPFVMLRAAEKGRGFALRMGSRKMLAGLSFGVESRKSQRLGGKFEDALLELLRKRGFRTVLDCGGDQHEAELVEKRVRAFSGSKSHLTSAEDARTKQADLMTWKGSLSAFGGWIHCAHVFIGYASPAAHVAAAHGIPAIVVFAGSPNELFRARWTPTSEEAVTVIPANGPEDGPVVLERIAEALEEIERDTGFEYEKVPDSHQ